MTSDSDASHPEMNLIKAQMEKLVPDFVDCSQGEENE